jgi:hypothetical protein
MLAVQFPCRISKSEPTLADEHASVVLLAAGSFDWANARTDALIRQLLSMHPVQLLTCSTGTGTGSLAQVYGTGIK